MSFGLGTGLAFIAFCQIAMVLGVAYLVVGRWVRGRPRAFVSAAIAAAYFFGRIQQAVGDHGRDVLFDPKLQVVLMTYVATILLFALQTPAAERIKKV